MSHYSSMLSSTPTKMRDGTSWALYKLDYLFCELITRLLGHPGPYLWVQDDKLYSLKT